MKQASYIQYIRKMREAHYPLGAQIEITNRCNLDCVHCKVEINSNLQDEMHLPEIKKAIRQIAEFPIFDLCLSGGELFTHAHIGEILDSVFETPIRLSLITNATLVSDEHVRKLAAHRRSLKNMTVSVYGLTPEVHDEVTQREGSFERTMETVLKFHEAGLPVIVNALQMAPNYTDWRGLKQFGEEYGIEVRFNIGVTAKDNGDLKPTGLRLTNPETIRAAEEIWSPYDRDLVCYSMDKAKQEFGTLGPDATISEWCGVASNLIYINHRGEIQPCGNTHIPVGNVKMDDVKDVWINSPILNKIRGIKAGELTACMGCEMKRWCQSCVGQSLTEHGDMFKPSPQHCDSTFLLFGKINKEGRHHG